MYVRMATGVPLVPEPEATRPETGSFEAGLAPVSEELDWKPPP